MVYCDDKRGIIRSTGHNHHRIKCDLLHQWVVGDIRGDKLLLTTQPLLHDFSGDLSSGPPMVVNTIRYFLFRSGMQFILAPVLGVLLGAGIGWVVSRFVEELSTSYIVKICAIAGGIAGFISLGIVFLNVYAN